MRTGMSLRALNVLAWSVVVWSVVGEREEERENVRRRGKGEEGGNIYREQKRETKRREREREREERQRNVVTDPGGRNISQHGP